MKQLFDAGADRPASARRFKLRRCHLLALIGGVLEREEHHPADIAGNFG
jgi:hypothetical protein